MIRSHRLFGPTLVTTTNRESVFTVPDGGVALIKSLRVVSVGSSAAHFSMWIGQPPAAGVWFPLTDVDARKVLNDRTWFVLEAGDELVVQADAGNVLWISASGALLTGAP